MTFFILFFMTVVVFVSSFHSFPSCQTNSVHTERTASGFFVVVHVHLVCVVVV